MRPNPAWDAASHEDAVETLAAHADELTYRVWGGDWCPDCRSLLPDFAAALDAAGVPDDRIVEVAVDREKRGPGVDEYGVEYIPTIVVEHAPADTGGDGGTEVARFVESEDAPPAVWLGDEIEAALETESA